MSSNTIFEAKPLPATGDVPRTLVALLRQRALDTPARAAYTFLTDGEAEEYTLTCGELDRQARAIGARLQSMVAPGERVLLLYPPGLDYVKAFFGCLYAGTVAVPAYPPRHSRNMLRLQAIVADAGATVALTTAQILTAAAPAFSQNPYLPPLRWLTTDDLAGGVEEGWQEPAVAAHDLAFLQYTSGSTSTPKGVMVSHSNLFDNEEHIRRAFKQSEDSVIVGWLPLYHDMGLIGNVIQPLYAGGRCVLMSPLAFLQRPVRWLQAITRYRATTSGGPNFAYDLCVNKITPEQRAGLDLSSWAVAFNGAEPVRHETLERFARTFEPCGFRRAAFYPCYGLAEATLLVSGSTDDGPPVVRTLQAHALEENRVVPCEDGAEGGRALVGCGKVLEGAQVVVVKPETALACGPGEVGEIWVASASVAGGYWNRPEETEATFGARLADTGEGPYLRTGDLGFLHDGELFVTGRLKDLIIIRGLNHYPQEIELTAERCDPNLRPGCGAAFTVAPSGEEQLVLVQEVSHRRTPDFDALFEKLRRAIIEEHEIQVSTIVLVKQGSVPKTSSGKIQRHLCRAGFLEKSLEVLAEWNSPLATEAGSPPAEFSPRSPAEVERWLASQLAAALGLEEVDLDRPVLSYGLDSLMSIELMYSIETKLGVSLPVVSFLRGPSVRELAAQLAAGALPDAPAHEPAALPEAADEHPLSRGQKSLWFLHRMAPESTAYNITAAVRILSELDASALRRAFQSVVERHPALRTTFAAPEGEPVQRVGEQFEVCFEERDAAAWGEAELDEALREDARRPFDVEAGPLLRLTLFTRSEREHVLLFSVHHLAADFWSLAVFVNELGLLYEAERSRVPSVLKPVSLKYTDYVRWQEQLLSGAEGERLWSYWERQLSGELPVLNLPLSRPRPPVQTYSGETYTFRLGGELSRQAAALGRESGATLYITLLAAFKTLLYRYTGQEDIVVGTPTAGRNWSELAGLVGYFVNPLVLRSAPDGGQSFRAFLEQVRQTVLTAFEHGEYPFSLLVERLQPARDPSLSPLFQVMFVLQKSHQRGESALASFALGEPGRQMPLGGLLLESMSPVQRVSRFDLTLMVAEVEGELAASFEYNTDLFDADTVRRMAEHFRTLLASAVRNPDQQLSRLPLLTREEEGRLLSGWNDTRADLPPGLCIHELFEQQAARTPDAAAAVFGEQTLTYAELNRRANALARRLVSLGVTAESYVGVLVERSFEMPVALLAVHKAGGAYVPADPAYPQERLRFIFEDARLCLLLTQSHLLGRLPDGAPQTLCLDEETATPPSPDACENLPRRAAPENVAYVIYTSGSTGVPKGVAIEHRSAVVMLRWAQGVYAPEKLAGVLASTSVCFDLSVYELFLPLSVGGKVILAADALQLPELPAAEQVTLVNTVPSAMSALLDGRGLPSSVKVVNLAGEALSGALARRVYAQGGVSEVWNLYGPSEDTTYSTYALVGADEAAPTIGRPVSNTQVYLLDRHLELVPPGVAGELCLGGAGLARGYLGRPALTAEKFIPDPFGAEPGARLYRTGDLARHLPDGRLEFLGRMDHQVKVRGFRVELGEIEAALAGHEGVRESVVLARGDAPEQLQLVAYVVPRESGAAAGARELRAYLKERLPEHLIPSFFVTLDRLPLTPNGKVDRRALPAPDSRLAGADGAPVAPRTQSEEVLANIWADVLGAGPIGIHDNFFELGGHSLLAIRVMSRVEEAFQLTLPVRRLFEMPTVAELAQHVEQTRREGDGAGGPPIRRAPRDRPLPLSFAQQRLWFLDQLTEAGSIAYHLPAAVRLDGRLDLSALRAALREVVRRHEVLRTVCLSEQGLPLQVVVPAAELSLPVVDLSGLDAAAREGEVAGIIGADSRRPFDLARGPLLRGALLRLGPEDHMLMLTMHHIVSDGWSLGVFVRELVTLYDAFLNGQDSPLAELPIQYADFAVWQREWLHGRVLDAQLPYWRRKLGGDLPALELPFARARLPMQTFRGAEVPVVLPAELTAGLKALSAEHRVTLFMTLLAAWQALLSRYTGQTDIVVGSPIAGRDRLETENLIGCFVNMLALRTDLSGDPSFADLLAAVRETTLDALAHADVPFEVLVEELQPERDLSHTPLFQVSFALQNTPLPELKFPGLNARQVEVASTTAKFDLTLLLQERDGEVCGVLEYNTDRFDAEPVARIVEHFKQLLSGVVARPAQSLSGLTLLTPDERQRMLHEWNDTRRDFPRETCTHQLFEAQVARTPDATAAEFEGERVSYAELNRRANRLAHHLRALGVGRGSLVGVLLERSVEMLVGVLAINKAGGAYVPLDTDWPLERQRGILSSLGVRCLLTQHARLRNVHDLQWQLPELSHVVCLDVDSPAPPPEALDAGAVRALWDGVAERATDRVSAGGFVSSYTGEPFTEAEVDEYVGRVAALAAPHLGPDSRVLEVGCGAGLIMFELAPRAGRYVGLDPSPETQARNRERAAAGGHDNVELLTGFAHDLGGLPEESFDLVVVASTAQFFPGPLYAERVVADALRVLAPGGCLLLADVMDARRRDEFRRSLVEYKSRHAAARTKTQHDGELYFDEDFFRDLRAGLPQLESVSVLPRAQGFANELGFRYDVLLRKAGAGHAAPFGDSRPARRKDIQTRWHSNQFPDADPSAAVTADDFAYIIFTSGSTGVPKGVTVRHRAVANIIDWVNRTHEVGPGDRLLFVTSLCFDLSVYDIFGALAAGATVCVASRSDLRDPQRLVQMLTDEGITFWDSAPAALHQLAPLFPAPGTSRGASTLRLVFLSGDWIPLGLPDQVRASFPNARVISLGGATEATVWSNTFPVERVEPHWASIPYGKPIQNSRYHILDRRLNPCPVDVPGDLYIAGECLAVGYTDPALTAEKFIPDPFAPEPGGRLYRTGDRSRYRADGNIEFLGRADHQVKVRGFRIELGEIETVLRQHPAVRDALVTVRDVGGDRRLVAYVLDGGGAAPEAGELRGFVMGRLPEYMVPSAFVTLDSFPVTANGKVDRQALPAPQAARPGAGGGHVEPRTHVEKVIAEIWGSLLGEERVGVNEDFYALGGHSLLATQVVSRVRDRLGVEMRLRQLLEEPTVAGFAARVEQELEAGGKAVGPITPRPRGAVVPLSYAQQRLWFLEQMETGGGFYNIPAAVRLGGRLDAAALERALNAVVGRHEVLRTGFTSDGGVPSQAVSASASLTLRLVSLRELGAAARELELKRLAAEEAQRPIGLTRPPLMRGTLVQLGDEEHVLLLTMHHIVSDGWSVGVLVREVAALYEAYTQGREPRLPELPLQYADYALWQREWLTGEVLERQLGYWRQRLADAPAFLNLPTDRPRPAVQTFEGSQETLFVPAELTAALRELSGREGATLFMTLLAAWQALLSRYTGQEDILVGTPVANRQRQEVEPLIGFFVNMLVLRTDLSGSPSFRELLRRVRETCLGAYAHQDVPFEMLVEELQPERSLSHSPLFQVMFALQNAAPEFEGLPGLTTRREESQAAAAKFDLTLWMRERPCGDLEATFEYRSDLFDASTVRRMASHFLTLLEGVAASAGRRLSAVPLLSAGEQHQLLREWNDTARGYDSERCVHELFEAQVARTPEAEAVIFEGESLSYAELNRRANGLARRLRALGVGPDVRVGICVERSLEMMVGLLGVLKAGGAYVPLDPAYPQERLSMMLDDARPPVVLTQARLRGGLLAEGREVICLDTPHGEAQGEEARNLDAAATPDNLAYVIYTSGSTGRPKGVMLSHRNVVNFFAAMDERLGDEPAGTWLAVTSISFDISVLELFWTLARGFRVVIQAEQDSAFHVAAAGRGAATAAREIDFSLFYFASSHEGDAADRYRLLLDGARFADEHGFAAVWTPERHFHAFGGLYPNPAVTSAALATITKRVELRAGSVVLPLHDPLRVAEEWAVVDNLSNGRVGLSVASGWHADDFVLAPENYADRHNLMREQIDVVRRLWRGESVTRRGGDGREVEVKVFPQPVRRELPVWLTAAGNPETFRLAGEMGANLLTHLLGQSVEELETKIGIYREAWRRAGAPGEGRVTLMLHTFVGRDRNEVIDKVRAPFCNYLKSSVGLAKNLMKGLDAGLDWDSLSEDELDRFLARGFERYYETSGLLGTPDSCRAMLDRLRGVGVDEVACLIDFGVDADSVMSSLRNLVLLKESGRARRAGSEDYSIPAQIARHGVTHMQCTPSLAAMLAADPAGLAALRPLRRLLLGGEALPPHLAEQLGASVEGELHNMYGPTETTIWSTTQRVAPGDAVTIGRPVANTEVYLLDPHFNPTPVGVPGELYIGGDGVARGYLGRPGLAAERFRPSPFGTRPGARLYRTGDLARYLPDGRIEFLGRVDTQVKLRGYRIELGEVESVLNDHPAVRESVVVVREDAPGDRQLVAYLVPAVEAPQLTRQLPPAEEEELLAGQSLHTLPNGLAVVNHSSFQANAIYGEIFENEEYLRHGVTLGDGDCVFDVGANIGLFTLFVHHKCRGARVYAFEPIPPTFEKLRTNVALYGLDVKLFQSGVSSREGRDTFTFYRQAAGLSGRVASTAEERETTRAVISSWIDRVAPQYQSAHGEAELDELLDDVLTGETYDCGLTTISGVMAEHGVERIDLLKIDVERSELDVLRGIAEEDWAKIRQVVMEVHGQAFLEQVTPVLVARGYELAVDRSIALDDGDFIYLVYAVRHAAAADGAADGVARPAAAFQPAELRAYLRERLPEYMVPSAVVALEELPRTPNGKLDRRALPSPSARRAQSAATYVEPQTEVERRIAEVWQEVLHAERVGIHDSFFDLGGTSLLLVQVHSRLRDIFDRDISMVEMFRHPTVHLLAESVSGRPEGKADAGRILERAGRQAEAAATDTPARDAQKQFMKELRRKRLLQSKN